LIDRGLVLNHSSIGGTPGYSHGYSLDLKLELLTKRTKYVAALDRAARL
jgi:hypothetical protein